MAALEIAIMQDKKWESEYRNPKLVTKAEEPQSDTLKFLKWLRKEMGFSVEGARVLDVGSGTGRNANYLAGLGAEVAGLEISDTALKLAKERAVNVVGTATYHKQDIGSKYPFEDKTFDIALDVMSSNSLLEKGREICVSELSRTLKPGGWLYIKALCKDGDKNALALLKKNPGPERDTYIIPEWGLAERVWSRKDFEEYYSRFFDIVELEKKTNYASFNGRTYKRNYWLGYMRNK